MSGPASWSPATASCRWRCRRPRHEKPSRWAAGPCPCLQGGHQAGVRSLRYCWSRRVSVLLAPRPWCRPLEGVQNTLISLATFHSLLLPKSRRLRSTSTRSTSASATRMSRAAAVPGAPRARGSKPRYRQRPKRRRRRCSALARRRRRRRDAPNGGMVQLCLAAVFSKPNQFVTFCERQLRRAREPVHKGPGWGVQPGTNRQRALRQHAAVAFSNWLPQRASP